MFGLLIDIDVVYVVFPISSHAMGIPAIFIEVTGANVRIPYRIFFHMLDLFLELYTHKILNIVPFFI